MVETRLLIVLFFKSDAFPGDVKFPICYVDGVSLLMHYLFSSAPAIPGWCRWG